MNWLDATIILFLALFTLFGFIQGLVKIILPAAGLMLGVIVAGRYYDAFAHRILNSHSDKAYVIAFVIIVIAIVVVAVILAYVLNKILSKIFLGWLDRLLGGILCLLMGFLLVGSVLAVMLKYSVMVHSIEDSFVASFLVDKFPLALTFLPGDFDKVKDYFNK